MELYTSLVRLKQAMNGGELPPMTPVPAHVHDVIDPAFTIGYGALTEDRVLGLRCPVRGCGRWFHNLTRHLNETHADVGGARGVVDRLSIPTSAPLASRRRRAISRAVARKHLAPLRGTGGNLNPERRRRGANAASKSYKKNTNTVGHLNMRNECQRQMSHRLITLQHQLGRCPSSYEANKYLGRAVTKRAEKLWGSWENVVAQCGLSAYERRNGRRPAELPQALASLSAYHAKRGYLPTARQARRAAGDPMLMGYGGIRSAFGGAEWDECMRRAASILNIRGGRYGLPEKQENAA